MLVVVSRDSTLSAQCALSETLVVVPSPICSAFRTTPLGSWTRGLYPGLPTAPAAACAGGNPFGPGTRTWFGEKSTPAGTLIALGSFDDDSWTPEVPAALASFGTKFTPRLAATDWSEASVMTEYTRWPAAGPGYSGNVAAGFEGGGGSRRRV